MDDITKKFLESGLLDKVKTEKDLSDYKELLGMWLGENEPSAF